MRWIAILIIFAIVLGIFIPPSLPALSGHDAMAVIEVLDVCHSAVPTIASTGDMPCLNVCSDQLFPLVHPDTVETVVPPFKQILTAYQDEQPPKA